MFNLINNPEIKEKAYEYVFSLCDSVTFLFIDYKQTLSLDEAILQSKYPFLFSENHFVDIEDMWNMGRDTYKFNLTPEIKALITEHTFNKSIHLTDTCVLENITLYKDNKFLYSICTHEGYEEFNEEFKNKVTEFCSSEIVKTNLYKELLVKLNKHKPSKEDIAKIIVILNDLKAYVQEDWQAFIRINPTFKCNFKDYLYLAKYYLSDSFYNTLKEYSDFKSLHQTGYPTKASEAIKFNFTPFENSKIYKDLNTEIEIWHVILLNEFGIENILKDLYSQLTPVFTINENEE